MCKSWDAIKPSRKDVLTQGTKEQIAANNAANEAWCNSKGSAVKVASNG